MLIICLSKKRPGLIGFKLHQFDRSLKYLNRRMWGVFSLLAGYGCLQQNIRALPWDDWLTLILSFLENHGFPGQTKWWVFHTGNGGNFLLEFLQVVFWKVFKIFVQSPFLRLFLQIGHSFTLKFGKVLEML